MNTWNTVWNLFVVSAENASLMDLITSFCITFISVALKGFQHKNVNHNKYKLIVITSFTMGAFEILAITFAVHIGLIAMFTSGAAAGIAMIVAIKTHHKLVKVEDD